MKKWSACSLKAKLTVVMTLIVLSMLVSSMAISATRSVQRFRVNMIEQVESLVEVMAHNLGPILAFGNTREGVDMLMSLGGQPHMVRARVHVDNAVETTVPFAEFNPGQSGMEMPPLVAGRVESKGLMVVTRPVVHKGESLGWLQLVLSTQPIRHEIRAQALSTLILSLLSCVAAYFLAKRFVRMVSGPIEHLASVAHSVTDQHDYSHRAESCDQEEFAILSDAFNNMLDQIQQRDAELTKTHSELQNQIRHLDAKNRTLVKTRQRESDLKSRLERAQRMESLGVLAGGVAHDLNNILGPIVGYPDIMLDDLEEDHPMTDDLIQIREAANKATSIVQDLLSLGRRGNYHFDSVHLNEIVDEYMRSAGFKQVQAGSADLTVKLELCEVVWPVKASSSHLNQVVMNLVINAVEAMTGAGVLTLRTQNISLRENKLGFEPVPPGDYVCLSVADTGEGVPKEHLEHIFEPFFTRKELGSMSGSGLGLAVVYGVAKDHDALVDLETELGEGTTFHFYFPRIDQPVQPRQQESIPIGGTEHILVVDDVAAQRKLAQRILGQLGYQASTVSSGREAIEFLREHPSVDLVLLDMVMEEGFDGLDTYRHIRGIDPDQKCVIVSGYSENTRIQEALSLGVCDFITKPYSRAELGHTVRMHLDTEDLVKVGDGQSLAVLQVEPGTS